MSFDADLIACAQLVEKGDPDRFTATMAAPVEARKVLFPIYAFNVEVAGAPWFTEEAMIAEMRLQWWRDAVEEIGEGKPPRAHEVVGPLAEVMGRADIAPTTGDFEPNQGYLESSAGSNGIDGCGLGPNLESSSWGEIKAGFDH